MLRPICNASTQLLPPKHRRRRRRCSACTPSPFVVARCRRTPDQDSQDRWWWWSSQRWTTRTAAAIPTMEAFRGHSLARSPACPPQHQHQLSLQERTLSYFPWEGEEEEEAVNRGQATARRLQATIRQADKVEAQVDIPFRQVRPRRQRLQFSPIRWCTHLPLDRDHRPQRLAPSGTYLAQLARTITRQPLLRFLNLSRLPSYPLPPLRPPPVSVCRRPCQPFSTVECLC